MWAIAKGDFSDFGGGGGRQLVDINVLGTHPTASKGPSKQKKKDLLEEGGGKKVAVTTEARAKAQSKMLENSLMLERTGGTAVMAMDELIICNVFSC
jgi:hypothetical protein